MEKKTFRSSEWRLLFLFAGVPFLFAKILESREGKASSVARRILEKNVKSGGVPRTLQMYVACEN